MRKVKLILRILSLLTCFTLVLCCAINPVTGKKQFMLMSEEQEAQMGLSYDPQVVATFGEYPVGSMLTFIQGKETEMGKLSHRPNVQYHLRILDSPVVNAFAVPGGYIYLTRGILAQLNNEAELMGILGHEMGHIAARHSISQQSKQQLGQLLLVAGMIASEKFAQYAEYAMQGMQLLFLKFSRDDERMADALGVEYSSKLGYDATKMADFFKVLQKMSLAEGQDGVPTFLSTHPDPGDRYNAVRQQARQWQDSLKRPNWQVNADNYLKMIDGIVYGEDPRQGYVEGNTFYHPELKFKFALPSGWKLENTPAQVNMAPEDGKALIVFTLASGNSLNEAASGTLKQLELTPKESKNITVGKLAAIKTLSDQVNTDPSTGQKQTNKILSYFIECDNRYYVFHGLAAETDFPNYSRTLESSMAGFSRLTDPARLNVKPKKILVKKVQRAGSLGDAFTSFGVKPELKKELALLNNLELTDKVEAGRLIKVIGE